MSWAGKSWRVWSRPGQSRQGAARQGDLGKVGGCAFWETASGRGRADRGCARRGRARPVAAGRGRAGPGAAGSGAAGLGVAGHVPAGRVEAVQGWAELVRAGQVWAVQSAARLVRARPGKVAWGGRWPGRGGVQVVGSKVVRPSGAAPTSSTQATTKAPVAVDPLPPFGVDNVVPLAARAGWREFQPLKGADSSTAGKDSG